MLTLTNTSSNAYPASVKGLLVLRPETVKSVQMCGSAEQRTDTDVLPFHEVARHAHPFPFHVVARNAHPERLR